MTDDRIEAAARVMDPVAFDERIAPTNLGQMWDRFTRQETARTHAERLDAAGLLG